MMRNFLNFHFSDKKLVIKSQDVSASPRSFSTFSSASKKINKTLWERTPRRRGCELIINAEE